MISTFAPVSDAQPTDARLIDAAQAPPHAFVVHGQGVTLMGLVARLAAAGQLEALRALDHASYVAPESLGTSGRPHFGFVIEADDEAWARIAPHVAAIEQHLEDISSVPWSVRRTRPLSLVGSTATPSSCRGRA